MKRPADSPQRPERRPSTGAGNAPAARIIHGQRAMRNDGLPFPRVGARRWATTRRTLDEQSRSAVIRRIFAMIDSGHCDDMPALLDDSFVDRSMSTWPTPAECGTVA
jgi:hypothetical protein